MNRLRPDHSIMRGPVAKLCGWIEAAALTVTFCASTSGCVPLAEVRSNSPPDVDAMLPADLRGSGEEVLVAKQMSSVSSFAVLVPLPDKASQTLTVDFVKASDLISFSKTLKSGSTTALGLAIPYGKFGIGGVVTERLERLCVVTPDGRVITLAIALASKIAGGTVLLDNGRRDAIVAALRAGGTTPFAGVDGPCGVSGTAEWPMELRTRVIDFLVRIPAINPRVATSEGFSNDVLASALRDSWTTETQTEHGKSGAMLLISAVWHGMRIAERPRFLTAEEFDRFSTSLVTVNTDAIVTLLPKYASGSYDPSNVSGTSLCLISNDGRAISVSGSASIESPNTRPRLPGWRDEAVTRLSSEGGSFDAKFPCLPPDTIGWSDADRTAAIGFLAAIPIPARDRTAVNPDTLHTVTNAADAGVLVLAVMNSAQGRTVVVPKLVASDDAKAVVSAIRAHTPGEFTASLATTSPISSATFEDQPLKYVCVIGSDGQAVTLASTSIWDWGGSHGFLFSDQSIRDAIAIVDSTGDYSGSFVCSLERSVTWPEEGRTQVIEFLKRIPFGK